MPSTYRSLIVSAVDRLSRAGFESARLDAEVLLMHVRGVDRTHLYLDLNTDAPSDVERQYDDLVDRRVDGEPIAYITGHREFMGIDFVVDSRVLIPRPETEGLVERALEWLARHPNATRVIDVGTGSGAIAVALDRFVRADRPLTITASDLSGDALDVAQINVDRSSSRRVGLVRGDLLNWCRGPIDLVVANLPYLRDEQRHAGIAREPDLALYTARQGFALYAQMLPQARALLTQPGAVMCEIDPDQRDMAMTSAEEAFPAAKIQVEADLAGLDRYLIIEATQE